MTERFRSADRQQSDKIECYRHLNCLKRQGRLRKPEATLLKALIKHCFVEGSFPDQPTDAELEKRIAELRHQIAGLERTIDDLNTQTGHRQRDLREQSASWHVKIEQEFKALSQLGFKSTNEKNWEYFISYPDKDRELAIRLFSRLVQIGRVFMDRFCLQLGQNWQELIPNFKARCRATVALITSNTRKAHFQISEIQRAINLLRQGTHSILPVYAQRGLPTPFGLEQIHGILPEQGQELEEAVVRHLASTSQTQ